jgi:hypothetical protein
MDVSVNYLAVFLAGLSSMAVGSIWYSQGVFGATWAKLAKVNMDRKVSGAEITRLLGLTFIASLITAFVLAQLARLSDSYFEGSFMQDTLVMTVWLWLAFTALRFFTHDLFEGRPRRLTILNASNELVTLMVMGLVIGLFGRVY